MDLAIGKIPANPESKNCGIANYHPLSFHRIPFWHLHDLEMSHKFVFSLEFDPFDPV